MSFGGGGLGCHSSSNRAWRALECCAAPGECATQVSEQKRTSPAENRAAAEYSESAAPHDRSPLAASACWRRVRVRVLLQHVLLQLSRTQNSTQGSFPMGPREPPRRAPKGPHGALWGAQQGAWRRGTDPSWWRPPLPFHSPPPALLWRGSPRPAPPPSTGNGRGQESEVMIHTKTK